MKKILLNLFFIAFSINVMSQSAFIKRQMDDSYLLERYEILNGKFCDSLYLSSNPVSQKDAVHYLENFANDENNKLSQRDKFEIKHFISKNGGEWATKGNGSIDADYPIFKTLYTKQSDMIHVQKNNYVFILNPIIAYQQMVDSKNTKENLFLNTKGLEIKGNIAKRLGFYSMFSDNQERGPINFQNFVATHNAVPGMGYYKGFKSDPTASNYKPGNAVDYINATGYIDADVIKNTVNISFGYDRIHIGDGYRSLFLSDFSAPYTFLRFNTRIWKFNYQNLYMELTPQYIRGGDKLLAKKYAAMHTLSINLKKWLNVGLFESVTYGRNKGNFEFSYLNPVILYRSIEQNNGSPDNAIIGLNFKINTGKRALIYGQVVLDEFKFSHIIAHDGWWANKQGFQLGLKAVDPFGIKNMFVQAELNVVRPYTYSFRDSVADYTQYNQSLAHPYGANFAEASLQLKYKSSKRTYLTLKTFYNKQGRDTSSSVSFGSNPVKNYDLRNAEKGIKLFNGYASTVIYTNLNLSYEIRDNFYFDLGVTYRSEKGTHSPNPTYNSLQVYTGFRLNAIRRQYDY